MTVLEHHRPPGAAVKQEEREQTIRLMLERYEQARSEANAGGGTGGRSESRLLGFDSTTWTREYRELERCLEALRALAQGGRPMICKGVSSSAAWWHLRERYLRAEVVRREVHTHRKHPHAQRRPSKLPDNQEVVARPTMLNGSTSHMLVRVWDSRVDPAVVTAAVEWIAREYRGRPAVYREEDSR